MQLAKLVTLIQLGHTLVRLDSVDSTNQYAAQWLSRATVPEGTVIIARSQWQGKGQRGNSWHSEEGKNLTFSLLLNPVTLPVNKAHLLTHMTALAVQQTLEPYVNSSIKWPNDVYCGDRKIAGILIENTLQEGKIKHCIAGIGLNVNQVRFPDELKATSLALETENEFAIENILQELLQQLEKYYYLLLTGQFELLHQQYLQHLYLRNVKKTYLYLGNPVDAEIIDVGATGKLVLKTDTGTFEADLKEIIFTN